MRLKETHIARIAAQVVKGLTERKLIQPRVSAQELKEAVARAITNDLMAEVKLDEEARKLMDTYRSKMNAGQIDERTLFQMIKKQLAKDKKMVL